MVNNLTNYYDYAAATPMLPEVAKEMSPYFSDLFYNPSALYLSAKKVKQALNEARGLIANGLGSKPKELIFTAGGTEANNIAIQGILRKFPNSKVIYSAIEHDSVIKPASLFVNDNISVNNEGIVDLNSLQNKIDDNTVLVSIMYVNNEIGTIQPIKKIANLIADIKTDRLKRGVKLPLYFHSDACQAVNYLDMQVKRFGVDLLTINSGKIYGPKQFGALYIGSGVQLDPLILGGGQESNIRSGTENVASIIGFAKAFSIVRADYKAEAIRLEAIRNNFINFILKNSNNIKLIGPKNKNRVANNVHLQAEGTDNEWLTMYLDEMGYQVATGSACSASSDEPSHVLKAIGLSDKEAQNSIRITFGRYTTTTAVNNLQKIIIKTVAK